MTAPVLPTPPEWVSDALCAQVDADLFFPEKGENNTNAKRVCARCDVRQKCLEWALEHHERYDVYGGLSARQRRPLERRAAA